MKNISILLIFFFTASKAISQEYVALYEVHFKTSKSNPNSYKKGNCRLYLSDTASVFVDETTFLREQLSKEKITPREKLSKSIALKTFLFKFAIQKNGLTSTYSQNFNGERIGYEEPRMTAGQWQIHRETQNILGYPSQKATTRFGGRNWVAWFTVDIPFSDGPYKFAGLPGLITRLESEDEECIFDLQSFTKVATDEPKPVYTKIRITSRDRLSSIEKESATQSIKRAESSGVTLSKGGTTYSAQELEQERKKNAEDVNTLERN